MTHIFSARVLDKIENRPGSWNSLRVGVFDHNEQVGEYVRNYPSLYNTFCPFKQGDKWYALYSRDYTGTRVMSLPDCKDLGGEERAAHGFCPVDLYVPQEDRDGEPLKGDFGFVAGCVWGDDTSWKIQYLDLSRASEGILVRSERFGYIPLPMGMRLKDAITISVDTYPYEHKFFHIATEAVYREDKGVVTDFTDAHANYGKRFNEESKTWENNPEE